MAAACVCVKCKIGIVSGDVSQPPQHAIEMRAGSAPETATGDYMCAECFKSDYFNITDKSEPPFFFDKQFGVLQCWFQGVLHMTHASTPEYAVGLDGLKLMV